MNDLIQLVRRTGMIFTAGNGGSAANAEHLASDLFGLGYRAMCLSSNVTLMTMLANDFGYPEVFSRQLKVFGCPGDLLITISCSGTSENIFRAIEMARSLSMDVYRFPTMIDKDYETAENEHLKMIHRLKILLKVAG